MKMAPLSCAWVLVATPSLASAEAIAVVPLAVTGDVHADEREQIGEAVAAELGTGGHQVLLPSDAGAGIERHSPGCLAAPRVSCLAEGLHRLGWPMLVGGRVLREAGGRTVITLELFETASARRVLGAEHTGVATDRAALLLLARATAAALVESLAAASRRSLLYVKTRPSNATVRLRGQVLGRTPWSGRVRPGHAVVRLELAGFLPVERELSLAPGGAEELALTLERDHGAPSAGSGRAPWQLPIGIGGAVLGAAGATFGAYWLLHGSCLEENAAGRCSMRLSDSERLTFGLVPLAIGVVLAAAGTLIAFVFDLGSDTGDRP